MASLRDIVAVSRSRRSLTLAAVLGVAMIIGVTGCYERVVRASGPGTSGIKVYEPNLKDERIPIVDDIEDAIFGVKKYGVDKKPM